jgi:hypothetical protein
MLVFTDVVEDGKFISCDGCIPFRQDELPDKVVKRTPEVVQHLSDAQANVVRYGRYFAEAIEAISRIRVYVFCDNIRVEIAKGRKLHAQRITLLSGPSKFNLRTFKGGHNDKLQKNSKDSKGARDTRAHKRRIPRQPKEGSQVNASQPEEVEPQTFSDPHFGGYTAKNTHSGSLEDA